MRRSGSRLAVWLALVIAPGSAPARGADVPPRRDSLRLDDFEAEPKGWKFVGGEEFPGAKGSLQRDTSRAHAGKGSFRLDADFRGGGAYVGSWKDLEHAGLPELEELRLWVQARGLDRLGVRVVDETGQCHQKSVPLPTGSGDGWREVVLKVRDLAGGEHWGGANDGSWHGAPRGLGLNIGKDALAADADGRATLWIDDLTAAPVAPGLPTLRWGSIAPTSCRPGYGTRVAYAWDAEPLGVDCSVFVHFVNAQGQMIFQADHARPDGPLVGPGRVRTGGRRADRHRAGPF